MAARADPVQEKDVSSFRERAAITIYVAYVRPIDRENTIAAMRSAADDAQELAHQCCKVWGHDDGGITYGPCVRCGKRQA